MRLLLPICRSLSDARFSYRPAFGSFVTVLLAACVIANDAAPTTKRAQPRASGVREAFTEPVIDPTLPNVLLLGDSISIGYHVAVRESLQGEANVFRPATNCGPSSNGVAHLDQWLGDRKWDVIHFNFGLHDLKYVAGGGKQLADVGAAGSHLQVSPDDYRKNLTTMVQRLQLTGATLIWRETTPVPPGSAGRVSDDSMRYNAIAAEVMQNASGIQTDPMHAFASEHADEQLPANVHYTTAGSEILGRHVAEVIRSALPKR